MLIDEIIELLSNDGGSITEALLKTKILLYKIGHRELIEWVKNELNGYQDDVPLPPYRSVRARVVGNMMNVRMRATAFPVPLGHLSENERDSFERRPIPDSLSIVAQLAASESDELKQPLPLEWNHVLSKGLSAGTHLEQAWCAVSKIDVQNVVFQVRSRLLDFMLELRESLGPPISDADIKEKSSKIDSGAMFQNAIFGPNATIVVGDHNNQKTENAIVRGDFNTLARELVHIGIDSDEVEKLQTIATNQKDQADHDSLRRKVSDWIKEQAGKQLDIGAQAAMAFSVDAVTHAVRTYFGF